MVMLKERSKITAKGQNTVPIAVRKVLGVSVGDEITYIVDENKRVSIVRADVDDDEDDPVIDGFLTFLAADMQATPRTSIIPFPEDLARRMHELTEGIDVDLNAPLDGPVSI